MAKWKGNPTVTLVGNVVRKAELRFTPAGLAVANLTMVTKDRQEDGGEWRDVDETFWRVTAWRQVAENLTEADLEPGQEIIVTGPMKMSEYEVKDGDHKGEKRRNLEVTANTLGVSLARHPVSVQKVERSGSSAASDPWTKPDVPEEPPF